MEEITIVIIVFLAIFLVKNSFAKSNDSRR